MRKYEIAQIVVIWILIISITIYIIGGFVAYAFPSTVLKEYYGDSPLFNIGLPASALSAFGLVAIFWKLYPPKEESEEKYQLSMFGLKFSGPGGPVTLWVICFLSFVGAMKILSTISA